jgi:undecaprenyl-diphosphatase
MKDFNQANFHLASEQLTQTEKYCSQCSIHHPLFFVLGGCLVFVSLALPFAHQHLLPGDVLIYHFIQEVRSPLLTWIFRVVTKAGSSQVLVPVGVGVFLWKRKHPRVLLFLVLYALGVILLEGGAKLAVARPRPRDYLGLGLPFHVSHGFPSGHALAAAAFYGMLLVLLRQSVHSQRGRQGVTAAILLLIILVGFSRLYLGVHWPSDVLGGWLLGGVYCTFATAVGRWIEKRSEAHNKV